MANLATMRPALMASEDVQSYLVSLKYMEDDDYAEIHDGALVTLGDLDDSSVYTDTLYGSNNGLKDLNVYKATAPAAVTDEVVIVDLAEVSQGVIANNTYKIGIKLVGLMCQAGFPARGRILKKHDKYWVSGDCFKSAPTVGEYATIEANSTLHVPANSVTEGQYNVKIEAERAFTVGNRVASYTAGNDYQGKLYLVRVL